MSQGVCTWKQAERYGQEPAESQRMARTTFTGSGVPRCRKETLRKTTKIWKKLI